MHDQDLARLSNQEVLQRLRELVARERRACAAVVLHLCEVERRGLHRDEGYNSLFAYCQGVLGLSESEAYARIYACRTARRFPLLLERLRQGRLHLSAINLLGPRLTEDDHVALLDAAAGKTKAQLQQLLAARFPAPDVPTVVRKLPSSPPAAVPALQSALALCLPAEAQHPAAGRVEPAPEQTQPPVPPRPVARPVVAPLSVERFKLQLTMSRSLHDKLRKAQELTRHSISDGDLATLLDRALQLLIDKQLKQHFAQAARPRRNRTEPKQGSRHIAAEVRRRMAERDGMRCTFVSERGHRCEATERLEFHHEQPHARNGAGDPDNIRLLCQAHNQLLAERDFGLLFMRQRRASSGRSSQA